MSTPEDTVMANVVYAVVHTVPLGTDATAPTGFVEFEFPTLNGAQDRHFIVDPISAFSHGNTGLDAQTANRDGYFHFNVVLRRINEAMSSRLFAAAILADVRAITDRVERYVREQGGGVAECVSDQDAVFDKSPEDDRAIFHCIIPFRVEFSTSQVTS